MATISDEEALNSRRVLNLMQQSLIGQGKSSSSLQHPIEAFALFVHSCMLAVDFSLLGFSEDDRIVSPLDAANIKPLPSTWNVSLSSYGFRYKHNQSSMEYLLKVYRLGGKCVVTGLGLGDDKTATMEVSTSAFFSESFFPHAVEQNDEGISLQNGFISASRIADLIKEFKLQIIQKLIPGLHKPGYEEDKITTESSLQTSQTGQHRNDEFRVGRPTNAPERPEYDPLRYPPRIPRPGGERPPDFEDEYEINQPPRGIPGYERHPLSIGSDDLNPPGLGRNPPLLGPFFGEGSHGNMNPYGEFGGPGGGGMYPTGTHPMFGSGSSRRGVGQIDPRFPPGSRYDPVGPRNDFPNLGPRSGGRGSGGFGGYGSGDFI